MSVQEIKNTSGITINDIYFDNNASMSFGNTSVGSSVLLDLDSTDKALLLSRLSDPSSDISTPVNGMLVYNSTTDSAQTYAGGSWITLSSASAVLNALANNGLSVTEGTIGLGGSISQNIDIDLDSYNFAFSQSSTDILKLNSNGSFSLGNGAVNNLNSNVVIGDGAGDTTGSIATGAISIGSNSNNGTDDIGTSSISIGGDSKSMDAASISLGYTAESEGIASISIGNGAGNTTGTRNNFSISIGYNSNQGTGNIGQRSVSLGYETSATSTRSISIGENTSATASGAIIIGTRSDGTVTNNTSNSLAIAFNESTPSILFAKTDDSYIQTGGHLSLEPDNLGLFGGNSFGSGESVIHIENATTTPVSNPSSGGILYVEGGALKYRGSSGTITTIAPA